MSSKAMSVWSCWNCGKTVRDEYDYCLHCNAKRAIEFWTCEKCGRKMPTDYTYCMYDRSTRPVEAKPPTNEVVAEKEKAEEQLKGETVYPDLDVPEVIDFDEGGNIRIVLSNPTESLISNLSVDLSDAKNYFEMSEAEVKFPPLRQGSRLEREIHIKPRYRGEFKFAINLSSRGVAVKREFTVKVTKGTRVYGSDS